MQSNVSDLNVSNWSVNDVIGFLHNIGINEYDSSFTSNHINGHALLLLTSQELKHDLGINSLGHRKQIIKHIEKLQNKGSYNEYANEYAMTACISAALSSILTQHYKSNGCNDETNDTNETNETNDTNDSVHVHPLHLLNDDHINDINNRNSIVRVAVCMATEAARYIIHNQERIINVINTHPINHDSNSNTNILDTLTNCRKLFAFNGNDSHSIKRSTNGHNNAIEAKRSNRAWSDCDERELIKLKSLGTLTWNRVGECLQRTGAACQLHWKTMKRVDALKKHIEYIKQHSNNNDSNYANNALSICRNQDIDATLLLEIDKVLKANQWKLTMLHTLLENVEKEIEQNHTTRIQQERNVIDNNMNGYTHIKKKKKEKEKEKRKKKHRKKKHNRHKKHKEASYRSSAYDIKTEPIDVDEDGRSSRSNARWTKEEEEILIKMLEQNKSLPDIATELGRTIPAINQHRLAMKHKNAKSLNDSSDEENNGNTKRNGMNADSEREYDSNESVTDDSEDDEEEEDSEEEEDDDDIHRKSEVVLTPIITPNSYVSNATMIRMPPQFNMTQFNGDTSNSTSTTTSSTTTNDNKSSTNTNTNSNPFKSMPVFNVHNKRSLSPPYLNNIAPPNKKARLSASDHALPLIPNGTENIVLPSLNTSFQPT